MQLSTFPTFVLVLLFLITWQLCGEAREAHKAGPTQHLCGWNFKRWWERCCGKRCGVHALKRSLGETMSAQKANGFLESSSSHVLKKRSKGDINAVEECCDEGCSIEEVTEYPC
ncbi:uncharacterized protein LOC144643767 [Oculina patagonica]